MPEMKKVYDTETGAELMMYAVDAGEAVKNGGGRYAYRAGGDKGRGMPPVSMASQVFQPGYTKAPEKEAKEDKEARQRHIDAGNPDPGDLVGTGFAPSELGGPKIATITGEGRYLAAPEDDEAAAVIQPFARRGTKAEQIAASNDGSNPVDEAPAGRTRKPAKRKKRRTPKSSAPASAPEE